MNDKEPQRHMWGIKSPRIIKSVELAVATKRIGIEVELRADQQGRKMPIHGHDER